MKWNLLLLSLVCIASFVKGVSIKDDFIPLTPTLNETSPPGTIVTTVQVSGVHVGVHYFLEPELAAPNQNDVNWFHIDNTTGVITVAKALDREESGGLLKFNARARKSGDAVEGKRQIFVTVLDVNDNYPQFENSPYDVNVSEIAKVGEVVLTVSASDRDTDNHFGVVSYGIAGGNTDEAFEIDPTNGQISLKNQLDFESSNKIYYLNVTATDTYGDGNQNWTIVTITVTDGDDLPARFSKYLYEVLVDVNTPKGLEVVKVHAEDQDTEKATVSYEIYPASDPEHSFLINNLTGSITVNKNLTRTSYRLIVTAKTTTHPPAFALVVVHAGAMPNRTFEASVQENKANTVIYDLKSVEQHFNVSDPVFDIVQGDEINKFIINQTSKELKVGSQELDREQRTQYILIIELLSNGINRGFARIVVSVLDTNDNTPKFLGRASVNVREDTSAGTDILTLTATDRDAGLNGTVLYEIISGNEQGFFVLKNQSGILSLSRQLDFETAVQYVLNISASDLGEPPRQTFTNITVHVIDVNDNSPMFQPRSLRVSLVEDASLGSFVAQCNATDSDAASNAQITYHIAEGETNKFSIDNTTGVITTSGDFDRDTGVKEYMLVIKAQDGGQHPRADIGFVIVSITDKNEHSPVISPLSYIGGVYKETTYYSLVATVKASDVDFDLNSNISYQVINGFGTELFYVEPSTGHVRVISSLADKEGSKFTLQVSASDGEKLTTDNAVVDIFVLRDEDVVILKAGVTAQEITNKRIEFLWMLEATTGGKPFIKYLQQENGNNVTLVTLHVVSGNRAMTGDEIIRSFSDSKELLDTTYKQWNIQGYQSPEPSVIEARTENEEGLSAVAGALICLGVIIGVGAIVILIILMRRKKRGKSPFKKKRQSRVTFNDSPFYIDPDHSAMATNQVETAQEAQEVIVHIPAEDCSSLEGSDTSSQRDIKDFVNFGYAARMAAMKEQEPDEVDNMDQNMFFPPPPTGPPPAPPDSDSDEGNTDYEIVDSSVIYGDGFVKHEDNTEVYRSDDEGDIGGIVLSQSPTNSTTGSTDQLVRNGGSKVAFPPGSFLRGFSMTEATTEL